MQSHDVLLPDHLADKVVGNMSNPNGAHQVGDPFLATLLDEVEQDVRAQAAQEAARSVQPDSPVGTSRNPGSSSGPSTGLARIQYGLD